jgi:hypothetical protein
MSRSVPPESPYVVVAESVLDVADRSRQAALDFFRGTNAGWGRRDLAMWLVTSYANAARKPNGSWPKISSELRRRVEENEVETLCRRTRERALEILRFRVWERPDFAVSAIRANLIAGAADDRGGVGYIALARPRMILLDRVMSLLVADCLTRVAVYESLAVCESCGEVSFEWVRVHGDSCRVRFVRTSQVVPKWASSNVVAVENGVAARAK